MWQLVTALRAATQSPSVATAANQPWRLHLRCERFAAMPCRAGTTIALMQLLLHPLRLGCFHFSRFHFKRNFKIVLYYDGTCNVTFDIM
jgi:hypothetical protein